MIATCHGIVSPRQGQGRCHRTQGVVFCGGWRTEHDDDGGRLDHDRRRFVFATEKLLDPVAFVRDGCLPRLGIRRSVRRPENPEVLKPELKDQTKPRLYYLGLPKKFIAGARINPLKKKW